ncbi:MAG: PEGA domain-containing protein [Sandaracinaceae bacterium]
MTSVRGGLFSWVLALAIGMGALAAPLSAHAQQDEAQALFTEANGHLARGLRLRGRRRAAELERALNGYLGVVRLGVRTRNVIFNLGLTHQELGRTTEAFNYYSEYLRTFDLSDEDRVEGERRLTSIRGEVAVVELVSEPEGADVRIDRRDLPVRGQTPLTLALPPGEHRVFFDRDGYESTEGAVTAAEGETRPLRTRLQASPVALQVLAPANGTLTLDGAPLTSGQSTPVPPGAHVLILSMPGAAPVERQFEVPVGGEPMVLEMNAEGPSGTPLQLAVNTPAAVYLDGARVGTGAAVSLPVTPGAHQLRLEAAGFTPLEQALEVSEAPIELSAHLGTLADNGDLIAARLTVGIAALIGTTAWAGVGLAAFSASNEFDDALRLRNNGGMDAVTLMGLADTVENLSVAAGIMLAVAGALAVTSIVLLVVPGAESQPSRLEVVATPTPGGGAIAARGTFGGAR